MQRLAELSSMCCTAAVSLHHMARHQEHSRRPRSNLPIATDDDATLAANEKEQVLHTFLPCMEFA